MAVGDAGDASTVTYVKQANLLVYGGAYGQEAAKVLPGEWTLKGYAVTPNLRRLQLLAAVGLPILPPMRDYQFKRPAAWQALEVDATPDKLDTLRKLHNGQVRMANFIATYPRSLVLSTPRTGKTGASLYAADFVRREQARIGLGGKALILCTKSNIMPTWKAHIDMLLPGSKVSVCVGKVAERIATFHNEADYYIMHFDTFKRVCEGQLPAEFCMCIIDEIAAAFRHTNTKRFKHAELALRLCPYVTGLTGTPMPEGPLDAYGLAKLLERTHESYTSINLRMRTKVSEFRWVYKREATDIAVELMRPSMRISAADIFPMSTRLPVREVWASLSPTQAEMAHAMMTEFRAMLGEKSFSAVHEGAKRWRMLQILAGVMYEHELVAKADKVVKKTKRHELDGSGRLAALEDILDEMGNRVIVYCPLSGGIDMLKKALKGRDPHVIDGRTSASERTRIMNRFNSGEGGPLIGEPSCMAHGLDLSRGAATIVWWTPIDKAEVYLQANERIEGINQVFPTQVIHLLGHKFEAKMYAALQHKMDMHAALLDTLNESGV